MIPMPADGMQGGVAASWIGIDRMAGFNYESDRRDVFRERSVVQAVASRRFWLYQGHATTDQSLKNGPGARIGLGCLAQSFNVLVESIVAIIVHMVEVQSRDGKCVDGLGRTGLERSGVAHLVQLIDSC